VKREPAEPQGFIKLTGVGIPRLQAGEDVNGMQLFDVFQLTDACDCDEESVGDYLYGRKPIPQSFKDALSKLMATKYYTLSGFNRNAR
jgi:hypothetical protein